MAEDLQVNTLPAAVPPAIAPALSTYLARIAAGAPGLLQAFYLIGSIALDAFQDGHSDVDFVALLGRQTTAADFALLRVLGPPLGAWGLAIEWDAVRSYMLANLNTYWRSFTYAPSRLAWLLTNGGVEWAVLGISRLWHALCTGEIHSKLQAGEYLLTQASPQWRPILAKRSPFAAGSHPPIAHTWHAPGIRWSSSSTSFASAAAAMQFFRG